MSELERFFASINFEDKQKSFATGVVNKVVINKKTETFLVYIENDNVISKPEVDA